MRLTARECVREDRAVTSAEDLLRTHQPLVKYDSQESYFADSAAIWTDNPGNRLIRAGADVTAPALNLAFLGPTTYADNEPAAATDKIGDPSKKYREQARKLHEDPKLANRVYGHAAVDSDGDQWLQYWFFFFFNDYNLIGNFLKAGLHEGDWEMVQIRLRGGAPDLAVYAQHTGAQSRDWRQIDLAPGTQRPLVYVARGSHASYFEPGTHWTGHWFDHADGKRRSPELTLEIVVDGDARWNWVHWPGLWGDTRRGGNPLDSGSPVGPGPHVQWKDPLHLLRKAQEELAEARAERPTLPPPPHVTATRVDGRVRLEYEVVAPAGGPVPTALTVTINSPDESAPPTTRTFELDARRGALELPDELDPGHAYDLYISAANTDGLSSDSVRRDLPPAEGIRSPGDA
jgi:hypothetical protein